MKPTVVDLLRSATALQTLTLQGPWGELVATNGKDVENRTWAPPQARVGGLLAIHQGLVYDMPGAQSVRDALGLEVPGRRAFKPGVVLAVAVLARVVKDSSSEWAVPGAFHWCLEGTVALPKPVPCKGAQGIWTLPPEVFAQVREQLLNENEKAPAVALSTGAQPQRLVEPQARAAQCPKCTGMEMYPGAGVHGSRVATGTAADWPRCGHGTCMYQDCIGKPCPPPCCQLGGQAGAP